MYCILDSEKAKERIVLYRNYLFESYIKVLERYKPKVFVFENVPGILSAKESIELDDKGFGDIIKEEIDRINAKHGRNVSVED